MNEEPHVSWDNALGLLLQWHDQRRPEVGRQVLRFIETELRLMMPALVRRSWPEDLAEDALRSLLSRLVEVRLPYTITNPRSYLQRAFRNHCIDTYRAHAQKTSIEASEWELPHEPFPSPLHAMLREEQQSRVHAALDRLPPADRVLLKLEFAPEWLTNEEVLWLAEHTRASVSQLRKAIDIAGDMHDLSRIFDPDDDDPHDLEIRRVRMERFRRRRSRAREKLKVWLEEEGA